MKGNSVDDYTKTIVNLFPHLPQLFYHFNNVLILKPASAAALNRINCYMTPCVENDMSQLANLQILLSPVKRAPKKCTSCFGQLGNMFYLLFIDMFFVKEFFSSLLLSLVKYQ